MEALERMVKNDLKDRGIKDKAVMEAFLKIDRARFVPEALQDQAYGDQPLPIGDGQTISQPYVVALMLQELQLEKKHRVLEVGAGSGYATALLAKLCKEVVATERLKRLFDTAKENLKGLKNVKLIHEPKELGASKKGPFDRILVSAASNDLPKELVDQLEEGGIMVIPLGTLGQTLYRIEKKEGKITQTPLGAVRFVPLKR